MPSIDDLITQRAALDRQIAEMQQSQKAEGIRQIKAIMQRLGITIQDLEGRGSAAGGAKRERVEVGDDGEQRGRGAGVPLVPAVRSTLKGTKVAPKYRDPVSGATWTGRGLQPRWLREAVESGVPVQKFLI